MKWKYCLNNIDLIHSHPCNPCPKMEIPILFDGTSKGEEAIFSGTNAKVRPSFLRISTFPVSSACSRTIASFCLASEYVS
jgi:hypothetical protein